MKNYKILSAIFVSFLLSVTLPLPTSASLISLDQNGANTYARSWPLSISTNGNFVTFFAQFSDWTTSAIAVRNVAASTTDIVTMSAPDIEPSDAFSSGDGSSVFVQTHTVSTSTYHLSLYDTHTKSTIPVADSLRPFLEHVFQNVSEDGQYSVFSTFDGAIFQLLLYNKLTNATTTISQNQNPYWLMSIDPAGTTVTYRVETEYSYGRDRYGETYHTYTIATGADHIITAIAAEALWFPPNVSADRHYDTYEGMNNGNLYVYARDRLSNQAVQVVNTYGQGPMGSTFVHSPYMSGDGRFIAYEANVLQDPGAPTRHDTYVVANPLISPPQVAPTLANPSQFQEDGTTPIPENSGFIGNSVVLKAEVSDVDSAAVALQVEVKPNDQGFDGTNIVSSATTTSESVPFVTTTLSVNINDLITPQGNVPAEGIQQAFHWRIRAVDGEGNVSDWVEFGSDPAAVDFSVNYTLGVAAAELAKQVVGHPDAYELGARGWVYNDHRYATPAEIINGYTYMSGVTHSTTTGPGIDCSGLIYWAFNKSHDPHAAYGNYVADVTADGMFGDKQSSPVSASELQPGDALFFDNDSDPQMDHVAMYVGESGGYDVVNAGSERTGITGRSKASYATAVNGFSGYRHIHQNSFEARVESGSPVDLIVTDPDGNTLSYDNITTSDEELIREIPGKLYYSEVQKGHDGKPEDVVYIPQLKTGVYHVEVVPNPDAGPDKTYSLSFIAGSTTFELAHEAPLSQIPQKGYGIVVGEDHSLTLDTTPPEAHIAFSTTTKQILVAGIDSLSSTTVSTSSTSTVVTDAAGNSIAFSISRNILQQWYASLIIPSFKYSTGTTTDATTSIRYFWNTNSAGKYTLFISALSTPTERIIALYTPLTNKTYIVNGAPSDDDADLSLKTALLLLRKRIKTFDGLVIPSITTDRGKVIINTL